MTRPHSRPTSRVTLMCALALTAGLASCAPTVQGPNGAYRPKTQTGGYQLFVKVVPVSELTDATPADAYVSFPQCLNTVVAVPDVRQLGPEAALDACRKTDGSVVGLIAGGAVVISVLLGFALAPLVKILQSTGN
ncbi:hypothetical protein [Deinococcus sp. RIT780]|uniref:hypothetical protein n=1 Tax=Deinococcus sp. RIT780 TaxID=2870472 RepID=UPI001C898F30|nr:hypothetical protein [Deinococcus sp. RIT780]MBX8464760.1 hypothetical protein [Deinococcus sp. RIT780]